MGCSHAWDVLEPLPGAAGGAGGTSTASGMGGVGGASAATTTSSAQGPGGSTSTTGSATSTAQGTGGVAATTDASSSGESTTDASSAASTTDASSSAASGTGGGGATAYYQATFAACNSDQDLVLANCEALAGAGAMYTDIMSVAGLPMHAYVRFDLDSQLAGKIVDGVTLRLTTTSGAGADSVSSGEIWQVMPFDQASLPMAQPATIGGVLGMDLGAVTFATDYYWGLPVTLAAASSPVFLGVISTSNDGVRYWNDQGMVPPLLIVNYH